MCSTLPWPRHHCWSGRLGRLMARHLWRTPHILVASAHFPLVRVVVTLPRQGCHTFKGSSLKLIPCHFLQCPLLRLRSYRLGTPSPPKPGDPCRRLSSPHHARIHLQLSKDTVLHLSHRLAVLVLSARLYLTYLSLHRIPGLILPSRSRCLRQPLG